MFRIKLMLLCVLAAYPVMGQDEPELQKAPAHIKLEPVFIDDFSIDSRSDYTSEGNVDWKNGQLILDADSSIEREINASPWAKIELELDWPELTVEQPEQELRIWFRLDGVSDCYVRLQSKLVDGKPVCSFALIDTKKQDGKLIEQAIRTKPHTTIEPQKVDIEYRHGLVTVASPGKSWLTAFVKNGNAMCLAASLETERPKILLNKFAVFARQEYTFSFSQTQMQQLSDARRSDSKLLQLYREGRIADAANVGKKTLEVRKHILGEVHHEYTDSLARLAFIYQKMGNYALAAPLIEQARDNMKAELGELHPKYSQILHAAALLSYWMGEYKMAVTLLTEALDRQQKALGENHSNYARSLDTLAAVYSRMGDYERAELLYDLSNQIFKKVLGKTDPNYVNNLNNLAALYSEMGDFGRAESLLVQSRAILKELAGEERLLLVILNNLAQLHQKRGCYKKAESHYLEARDVILKEGAGIENSIMLQATLLNNLGMNYYSMGDYKKAEPMIAEACAIFLKKLGEHPDYAYSLNSLAKLFESKGDYDKAEALFKKSVDILERTLGEEHPIYAASLKNLALLTGKTGNFEPASTLVWNSFVIDSIINRRTIDTLSEAQALSWMQINEPCMDLVLTSLRLRDDGDSQNAYQAVWQTKQSVSRLRVNQSLDEGASEEAKEVFGQLRDARLRLAKLVSATPEPEQAEEYRQKLAEANDSKEQLEKKLASVNLATKRAIAIRDASVDQLLEQLPPGVAVVDLIQLDDWKYVDQEIALNNEDGTTEKRMVKRRVSTPVYDAFVVRPDSNEKVSWIQLGNATPIDTAVKRWRLRLTGEPENGLNDELNAAKELSGSAPSADLRRLIWEKLEPQLSGCHTVIILPDGALNRIPWTALPGKSPGSYLVEDYAIATANYGQQLFGLLSDQPPQGENLLVAGGIKYDEKSMRPAVDNDQLAIRSIEISKEDRSWPYLYAAECEADAVSALWRDSSAVIKVTGSNASETVVSDQLENSRYAHLATHGFFDKATDVYWVNLRKQPLFDTQMRDDQQGATVAARNPLLMTGIVLSGANVEPRKNDLGIPIESDGILTAEEIVGLNLRNLELVTLSACETGLGDVAAGEGVFGLQRALHQAGARSVVSSLWKVSDKATEQLMIQFYSNLWEKKMSKVEALRQAQLWILRNPDRLAAMGVRNVTRGKPRRADPSKAKNRQTPSAKPTTAPRLWAAFQLSGDWR